MQNLYIFIAGLTAAFFYYGLWHDRNDPDVPNLAWLALGILLFALLWPIFWTALILWILADKVRKD